MINVNPFFKRVAFVLLIAFLAPTTLLADSKLTFSDLGLDDGTPCTLPLQNEKLTISYNNGKGKFNAKKKVMAFSEGTTITIKAKEGEMITGILLKTTNKIKDRKKEMFSSEIGKCRRGLWTGSANTVTIKCLQNCDVSAIRAAFSSDQPEAYAVKEYELYVPYSDGESQGIWELRRSRLW